MASKMTLRRFGGSIGAPLPKEMADWPLWRGRLVAVGAS